ncbi:MAG: TolC family protein, partial [Terrimicrobiaceae bacterium]
TRRAVADFFPEVKIEGNYAYSAFQYNAAAGDSRGDHAQGVNGYGAFLTAKWDLFDGFARVAQERKRRDEENASREELVLARLDATRDVWSACQTALASARRVDYAEGFVASAKENFESVSLGYEGGLHTVAEISEAASQLAVSRSARAVAVAEYSTSLASLALAVGQPVPEKPAALGPYERDTK